MLSYPIQSYPCVQKLSESVALSGLCSVLNMCEIVNFEAGEVCDTSNESIPSTVFKASKSFERKATYMS